MTKTTYLEMFACPKECVEPPMPGLTIQRANPPSVAFYRFLYHEVGDTVDWESRKKMSDEQLRHIVCDPKVEIDVLYLHGSPIGFAEIDRHQNEEIELVQFGLIPEILGQGLGRYFLNHTIHKVWSYCPQRFWLHTCNRDHPRAIPTYAKAGFSIYKEETVEDDR